jgi:hypothetical protein
MAEEEAMQVAAATAVMAETAELQSYSIQAQ